MCVEGGVVVCVCMCYCLFGCVLVGECVSVFVGYGCVCVCREG